MLGHRWAVKGRRVATAVTACLALGLTVAPAPAQQKKMAGLNFSLWADKITITFDTDVFVATGNCKVIYESKHKAAMTAAKMMVKFDEEGQRILELTTDGPTHVDLTTPAPNAWHFVGDCSRGASFGDATQLVTMTGDVDMTADDATGQRRRKLRLTGDAVTANMKTGDMSVEGNQAKIELLPPGPEPQKKQP